MKRNEGKECVCFDSFVVLGHEAAGRPCSNTDVFSAPQILAALPYDWSGGRLLFFSCLRVIFIPLFVMCVYPANAPTLSHPAWPCLFSLLMGVTNGYFGSVPMIQAAGKVPPEQRELAGELLHSTYRKNVACHLSLKIQILAGSSFPYLQTEYL